MSRRGVLLLVVVTAWGASGCAPKARSLSRHPYPIFNTKPPRSTVRQNPRHLRQWRAHRIVTQKPGRTAHAPIQRRNQPYIGAVTIVVDAGHGGHDPGALGVGPMREEFVNLGIATRLTQFLEQAGAEVITTRTSDRFITLNNRAALAERNGADLFVSIHADAASRSSATGSTIYIARNASAKSVRAADRIAEAFERVGIKCRGVNRAGFRVLVGHSRPAVLIECGYLTNHAEARRLATSVYQARIAQAIADGIADYFGH